MLYLQIGVKNYLIFALRTHKIYMLSISYIPCDEGMGSLCRFYYKNGLCANQHVESYYCVGKENCHILIELKETKKNRHVCEYDLGCGVYCKKYQRFFCAGRENCDNIEDYMKSFADYCGRIEKGVLQ